MQEQNITVKIVEVIMAISLKMGRNRQAKGTVIMVFA
jgi:hypothetical protein